MGAHWKGGTKVSDEEDGRGVMVAIYSLNITGY